MFVKIGVENYKEEISDEKKLVLLAYISKGCDYKDQMDVLKSLSESYAERLKVCLLDENLNGLFQSLDIDGSPTFILLHGGEKKGRTLGKADIETLTAFISEALQGLSNSSGDEFY